MSLRHKLCAAFAGLAITGMTPVSAHQHLPLRIEHRAAIRDLPAPSNPTHSLELRAVNLDRWPETEIHAALRTTAQILGQCGIRITRVDVLNITAAETHRYFDTAGTRQVPAFDAEAIGRGNSRSRPELADTVWVARGARDLGIVVAHELAHVLMDSGEHDNTADNLMAESTTPQNTQLTTVQCERMTATGRRHGLLRGVD